MVDVNPPPSSARPGAPSAQTPHQSTPPIGSLAMTKNQLIEALPLLREIIDASTGATISLGYNAIHLRFDVDTAGFAKKIISAVAGGA